MNPRPFTVTILSAALLLIAAGCSKKAPEAKLAPQPVAQAPQPAAKPAPVRQTSPAVKPAPKPQPAPPAPEPEPEPIPDVLFSLRGLDSDQLANDRPLFVGVRVEPSVESSKVLILAPATGRWSDGLKVELATAGAPEKVLLQARRADDAGAAAPATLNSGSAVEGTWYFASADITKLAPGDYQVQVKLAIPDGAGWHGNVAGEPAAFKLVAAAGAVTPGQQTQRAVALASEAMLVQDWPKAAQLLDERLATDPDNIDLLKSRAVLCLQGDNPLGANVCVNRAWARVLRENWTHPPGDLYMLGQAVMAAMAKPPTGAAKEPLPGWSMPPDAVLAPIPDSQPAEAKKK